MKAYFTFGFWAAVLVIAATALLFRVHDLAAKPMHGDEANQAVRTGLLMDQGVYHYDPTDHHGPVLYFAALPLCRATAKSFAETTEWNYRLVPVIFSILTMLLIGALYKPDGTGLFRNPAGALAALAFTAVSPAMNYYSRFFIQETMFVTFLTGMLVCAVRYGSSRHRLACALGFGACLGLAAATKETVVLSLAAAAVAGAAVLAVRRQKLPFRWRDAAAALAAAAFVAVLFYSSFFTYPQGVAKALFATAGAYLRRATETPIHTHPWYYYFQIVGWFRYGRGPVFSEFAVLAVPVIVAAVTLGRRERRGWGAFVLIYTLTLTALYSAIPYKTPWCALGFLQGFLLLAGVGVGALWEASGRLAPGGRLAAVVGMLVLLSFAFNWQQRQSALACFKYPADARNPYVYAHTGTDALNLVAAVKAAAAKEQGLETPIAVAVPPADMWPLPWYFRAFKRVGYWTSVGEVPAAFEPRIVIAAGNEGDRAAEAFGHGKRASFYGIRPGILLNVFLPEETEK